MRILVLGAGGMMGHMACRVLGAGHDVYGTTRNAKSEGAPLGRFLRADRWLDGVDVQAIGTLAAAIDQVRPDAVFNCIGIVKQLEAAHDAILSIEHNALFPHRLAELCDGAGARLVHLSTDCVFSGRAGPYRLEDIPDPVDLYGRSKLLGETSEAEGLTLRTSIVGRQLSGRTSLFEWVLANRGGRVRGFDRAIYSGLTTMALAEVVEQVLAFHPDLTGVWQVASEPVSKYRLLQMLDDRLGLGLEIERDEAFACDRSLDGSAFADRTGIEVPTWEAMLDRFAGDQATYAFLDGARP
jgi:dTDP-4-dehydrorhamnose reductase